MRVAYVFATTGHTVSYKLGKMILPQLEADGRGGYRTRGTVDGVTVGCFPDLYRVLEGSGLDQVMTL